VIDRRETLLALHAADFDAATLAEGAMMKDLYNERADNEPSVTALGKFDPDDFDTHEDTCLNLMSLRFGVPKEPLRYIVHPAMRHRLHSAATKKKGCSSSHLWAEPFNWTTRKFTESLKLFLLILGAALGLSPMTWRKMDGMPT
jgi:hypothetical protein